MTLSTMKLEIDSFAGTKIYPGRGRLFVRYDSKTFRFFSSKSESLFKQRKNPRRIAWTVLYRRQHRKGTVEETKRRRTKKTVKSQRAVVGASLDVIKERRSVKPEVRKAEREKAISKAKEQKKAAEAKRRENRTKQPAAQVPKVQAKGGKGR